MPRCGHAVALLAVAWAGALADVRAQPSTFPAYDVRIDVSIDGSAATVAEDYLLTRPPGTSETFEMLGDPCTSPESPSASIGERDVRFVQRSDGPWRTWSAALPGEPLRIPATLHVHYVVRLAGPDPAVPLLMPASTLDRAEGARGANVNLRVTFARDPRASVLMPRLVQTGNPGTSAAQLLAIPSIVRVGLAADRPAPCDRHVAGTTGGLGWRFWIFVGTMATWVPLYLTLAARRREGLPAEDR